MQASRFPKSSISLFLSFLDSYPELITNNSSAWKPNPRFDWSVCKAHINFNAWRKLAGCRGPTSASRELWMCPMTWAGNLVLDPLLTLNSTHINSVSIHISQYEPCDYLTGLLHILFLEQVNFLDAWFKSRIYDFFIHLNLSTRPKCIVSLFNKGKRSVDVMQTQNYRFVNISFINI